MIKNGDTVELEQLRSFPGNLNNAGITELTVIKRYGLLKSNGRFTVITDVTPDLTRYHATSLSYARESFAAKKAADFNAKSCVSHTTCGVKWNFKPVYVGVINP